MQIFSGRILLGAGAITAIVTWAAPTQALLITPTNSADDLIEELIGSGIIVDPSSISLTGAPDSAGIFTDGLEAGLGFDSGILLTTGLAIDAKGPNGNGTFNEVSGAGGSVDEVLLGASSNFGLPGDAELAGLVGSALTLDATVLEFDFETSGGDVFFNYVFASEEYIDFENTEFNDVFGFFLNDENIALLPDGSPVSINTVNSVDNAAQFNKNISPVEFDLEYDGFTSVFTAKALNLSAGTHTIKLAISDTGDGRLDSAVFLQANTFSDVETPVKGIPEPSLILGGFVAVGTSLVMGRKRDRCS